ncbi:hypothetical protein DSO57_1020911 [Entomophthora muscae]|uniref:Uncharacterized protein n=1 Tax=Entomophthora muscae TaxID=34485 RepID=A0ACC2SGP9_9FUNG|nr:hypothetical protein DSO57_1020911 [Entomophthora muscae]
MTPPHTPRPNCLQESVATDESTSTQPQSCGGLFLLGLRAVCPQVLKNPPQVGSLTSVPFLPILDKSASVPPEVLEIPSPIASCTPWVVTGLVLMGLNCYFPQLSPVSSFCSSLRAAIPVLHWVASWWFLLPGWEPNLVSLAPLSHTNLPRQRLCWYPLIGQHHKKFLKIVAA